MRSTDVLIIGGGLAGLALGRNLHSAGVPFHILEARNRLGGRIKTFQDAGHAFDLGPSWFWPGQPRMAKLAHDLGLSVFDQFARGDLMFEQGGGAIQRIPNASTMGGSYRIRGGMTALINGLSNDLPANTISLSSPVVRVEQGAVATLDDGSKFKANHVVLACPPRVLAGLEFSPLIDQSALRSIPTWMGGQAKFVATYDTPFWRHAGLSGDAMSRTGPLAEIHDASPQNAELGALFGFVGVQAAARVGNADAIIDAAVSQMGRLFGTGALSPRTAYLEDWAAQDETSSPLDHAPLSSHPHYGLPAGLESLWAGTLHLGSTETAAGFGGFLEGALERANDLTVTLLAT